MNRLKVLLVDDNVEFLEVASEFLSGHSVIEVAGRVQSGRSAVEATAKSSPDLVLMDLAMPGMNGLEATRKIKALPSPPHVIIVTLYDGPQISTLASDVGADGFVTKSQFGEALLPAIFKLFPELREGGAAFAGAVTGGEVAAQAIPEGTS